MKSLPEESYFLIRCWWLCIDIHIQNGLQAMGYYDFIPIMWVGSTMQNCVMSSLQREGWAEAQPSWLMLQGQIQQYNPLIQNTADKPTNYFCLSRRNPALSRDWENGHHYWKNSRIHSHVIEMKVRVSHEACLPIRIETKYINLQILATKWIERYLTMVFKASCGWTSYCTQCRCCSKLENQVEGWWKENNAGEVFAPTQPAFPLKWMQFASDVHNSKNKVTLEVLLALQSIGVYVYR